MYAAALRTRAERTETGWRLTGTKAFISGGGYSDAYVVMARSGGDGPKGVSAFVLAQAECTATEACRGVSIVSAHQNTTDRPWVMPGVSQILARRPHGDLSRALSTADGHMVTFSEPYPLQMATW